MTLPDSQPPAHASGVTAHTPGPWTNIGNGFISAPDGPMTVLIARVGDFADVELLEYSRARWEADAALISAAPDLLAALTGQQCFECRQWIEVTEGERRPCDVCAPALAAIAKARGDVQP